MRVVKFDCPGTEDPQPQLCGVPDAVPGERCPAQGCTSGFACRVPASNHPLPAPFHLAGTVKVAEPRPAEKLDKAAAASPAGAPINAGSKAVRLGGALLALATAVLLA